MSRRGDLHAHADRGGIHQRADRREAARGRHTSGATPLPAFSVGIRSCVATRPVSSCQGRPSSSSSAGPRTLTLFWQTLQHEYTRHTKRRIISRRGCEEGIRVFQGQFRMLARVSHSCSDAWRGHHFRQLVGQTQATAIDPFC